MPGPANATGDRGATLRRFNLRRHFLKDQRLFRDRRPWHISDVLPFGRLWHSGPNAISNAIGDAMHYSRSEDAVIGVYDDHGNVIETHEHKGESSMYTTFGSTLTITGERNVP